MRRRYLVLAAILLLLAGGAALVQRVLFPDAPKTMEVLSVRGEVTIVDPVSGGNAILQAGTKLKPGETVKTGHEGEAILQGRGNATITLAEHSAVRLDDVSRDGVSKFALTEGRVRSVVPEGSGGGVEITGGNDKASVATRGGDIAVGIDGHGDLSVATFRGKASLTAGGATRELGVNELAVVSKGKVQIGAIPTSVLLKVAWPESGKTNEPKTNVQVVAPPGATVRVNDTAVTLDSSGRATVAVKLVEGENKIHLEAQDVVGNKRNEDSQTIVLDTRPPDIHGGKARWK